MFFYIKPNLFNGHNLNTALPVILSLDTKPSSLLLLSADISLLSPKTKYLSLGITSQV